MSSEKHEHLSDVAFNVLGLLSDHIEADSLGERSALSDSDDITSTESEGWRAVSCYVSVTLLKSIVLLDVMEIVTTKDNGVLHLSRNNDTPNAL